MFRNRGTSIVVMLVVLIACAGRAYAQAPAERLAHATIVECAFTVVATGNWTGGAPAVVVKPAALSVSYGAINVDEGTAEVAGASGSFDIVVRLSNGILHLVQSFREGPLYTTTVWPKETRGGRLQAVHTRHEYTTVSIPGYTSQPEQYYGDCAVR